MGFSTYFLYSEGRSHGFGWDRVDSLCGGLYDAVLWIFDENSGDNTPMFLVVAEQCLHRAKDFSASCAALPARRLEAHQELGRDTVGIQTDQRDVPCHMASCSAIKNGVKKEEEGMFRVMAFVFPRNCNTR